MGDIVGDINRRRGLMTWVIERVLKLLRQMCHYQKFGYVTTLRTLSSGRATSTMEFSHYAETPSNISEAVIKKSKGNA
jgi:elongation factor G